MCFVWLDQLPPIILCICLWCASPIYTVWFWVIALISSPASFTFVLSFPPHPSVCRLELTIGGDSTVPGVAVSHTPPSAPRSLNHLWIQRFLLVVVFSVLGFSDRFPTPNYFFLIPLILGCYLVARGDSRVLGTVLSSPLAPSLNRLFVPFAWGSLLDSPLPHPVRFLVFWFLVI
jgi:hypothetical protein